MILELPTGSHRGQLAEFMTQFTSIGDLPTSQDQAAFRFTPRPIVSIGAGGIVHDAHLPAYRKAGFPVVAILDPDLGKAEALAAKFGIPNSFRTLGEALPHLPDETIYDVAVPANAILSVLQQLPDGAAVLIQKPIGETLEQAVAIERLCREKGLVAAANFSLRWAPVMVAARARADAGHLGEIHAMDVLVSTYTPWHLWSFMTRLERLEILYHSIHYVDLVRSWFGNPNKVLASTTRNPLSPNLVATRSVIVLDYGPWKRVSIVTGHTHVFEGTQRSQVQWEGTEGAMEAVMGLNLDYPKGKPDALRFARRGSAWEDVPFAGEWFPDAFVGSMTSLQAFVAGVSPELPTKISDALDTMRTVEAAYTSSELDGQALPEVER
jgi:predicted dehydrogenase